MNFYNSPQALLCCVPWVLSQTDFDVVGGAFSAQKNAHAIKGLWLPIEWDGFRVSSRLFDSTTAGFVNETGRVTIWH